MYMCFTLKMQVKDKDTSLVCFADTEQGMLGMLTFYVACFGEGLCTICGPCAQISFFFLKQKILLTHREHLIYIYSKYLLLVLKWLLFQRILDNIKYLCAHTGVQQGNVNMQSSIPASSGSLWTFKKLRTWKTTCPETRQMLFIIQMWLRVALYWCLDIDSSFIFINQESCKYEN